MPRVRFEPMGLEAECAPGESLFEVARRLGVPVATACVGNATCGLCRLKVVAGGENLSPINDAERKHLGNVYFITRQRLSCQARVLDGTVAVQVPISRLRGG
jgi:adenylate cyclase